MKRLSMGIVIGLLLVSLLLGCRGTGPVVEEVSATPTPTDTPVPTSTPTPTPEPITEARLSSGEFDGYFDDAVFIGDSLTKGFSTYIGRLRSEGENALGEAAFMGTSAMSVKNACRDINNLEITFTYRGRAVSVTEGINAMGAKKAFILLGLNDVAFRLWTDVEGYFSQLIEAIQAKCPDTEIVIQGLFPVNTRYCRERGVKIDHWNTFNEEVLRRVCEAHQVELYDFSQMLMDEAGYLSAQYSDGGLYHLSVAGDQVWHRAMRLYAAKKMYPAAELQLGATITATGTPSPDSTPAAVDALPPGVSPTPSPEPTPYEDRLMVALTFDDGPRDPGTTVILDLMERYGVKGTFFVLGTSITEETAPILRRMADLGCEIGIHGLDHATMSNLSYEGQGRRIAEMKRILAEHIEGFTAKLLRPPGGASSNVVKRVAKESGLSIILWSVDTMDWESENVFEIMKICRQKIKNGSIVLFHDKLITTGRAVEELIPWLLEQGYELVTVSELLESRGVPLEPGETYWSKSFE